MNFFLLVGMFLGLIVILITGFPVAFGLAGGALIFALLGIWTNTFDPSFLSAIPERLYGMMLNENLLAVPLFVFMGVMLERAKIAEDLLSTMAQLFGRRRGGLALSVCLVGGLMAASTGIVGATVVTMGLISLPIMLKQRYSPELSTGIICASGTLGQIIPPSIVLVILGDVLSSAYQQAQLRLGEFSPKTISVGDLFVGAVIPGVCLMVLYMVYIILLSIFRPASVPQGEAVQWNKIFFIRLIKVLLTPLLLIVAVLGSILGGVATPTEAASVGAVGAMGLALLKKAFNLKILKAVMLSTTQVTAMVYCILVGASIFSLVFRGFGGDEVIQNFLMGIKGGATTSLFIVMLTIFILGFFIDFFEIVFVVVPIVGPVLLMMGVDPVWLGVMIGINLQTSFLTPPFGFALFYLRGVAPPHVTTLQIYKGVIPFIVIQLILLAIVWFWPELATWLPHYLL